MLDVLLYEVVLVLLRFGKCFLVPETQMLLVITDCFKAILETTLFSWSKCSVLVELGLFVFGDVIEGA